MLQSGLPMNAQALSNAFPSRTVDPNQFFQPGQDFRVNANAFSRNEGVPNGGPAPIGSFAHRDILQNVDDSMFRTLLAQQSNNASSVTTQTGAAQMITSQFRGYAGIGYNAEKSSRREILCVVYPMKSRQASLRYGSVGWVNTNLIDSNANARAALEKVQLSEATREAHERSLYVMNNGMAGSKRHHIDDTDPSLADNPIAVLKEDPFFCNDLDTFRERYHLQGYGISSEDERKNVARTQYGARVVNTIIQGRSNPVTNIYGDVRQCEQVGFLVGRPGMGTGMKPKTWKEQGPVMMMPYRTTGQRVPIASSMRPLENWIEDHKEIESMRSQLVRPDGSRFDFLGETDPARRLSYVGLDYSRAVSRPQNEAFFLLDQLVSPDTGFVSNKNLGTQNDLAYRDVETFIIRAPPNLAKASPLSKNPFDPAANGVFTKSGIYTQHIVSTCIVMPLGIVLFPVEGSAMPDARETGRCITDPQNVTYHMSRAKVELFLSVV